MQNIILKTERLNLEIIDQSHFDDLYNLLSNRKVQKYFPKTLNKTESEQFYEKIQNRYKSDGYCYWAVIRKYDMKFLGICGVINQIIDEQTETEIGYRLLDFYWGKGYGTEAVKGCAKYAKEKLKKESIISLIRSENLASIRVAEKNGFKFEKESLFQELPHQVYRLQL
jgi:RimJ/RimL family protein N-acetyltransferase